jgi:excinuclease ABC subunit A
MRGPGPPLAGQGLRTIEMHSLPGVKVPCESCHGERLDAETLAVSWRGKNIGGLLQRQVDEAVEFFASMPQVALPLQLLRDVGLG